MKKCVLILALLGLASLAALTGCVPSGETPHMDAGVESAWPEDGAAGLRVGIQIVVTFTVPMEEAATESAFSMTPPVGGSFSWSGDGTLLTYTPAADLACGTAYLCSISAAARAADGTAIASAYAFEFTTGLSPDTNSWHGAINFSINGTALALDGDADGYVDTLVSPATITVDASDVPADAVLVQALLYWGGTQPEGALADTDITVQFPGGEMDTISADSSFADTTASTAYDVWVCKRDITWDILSRGSGFTGSYGISGYSGLIEDGATDNASAALILIYEVTGAQDRSVCLYDTLWRLTSSANTIALSGLDAHEPIAGKIAYYTLEGDLGGTGTEQVSVQGSPGGLTSLLFDAINPAENPMNHTINVSSPAVTSSIGADIDCYDAAGALSAHDTILYVTYSAGVDSWWHVLTICGVD